MFWWLLFSNHIVNCTLHAGLRVQITFSKCRARTIIELQTAIATCHGAFRASAVSLKGRLWTDENQVFNLARGTKLRQMRRCLTWLFTQPGESES